MVFRIYEELVSSLKNQTMIDIVHRAGLRIMTSTIYQRVEKVRHTFDNKRVNTITQLKDIMIALESENFDEATTLFKQYRIYSQHQIVQTGSAL